nr:MAG TPA: hypothetical protein [Caudoviricetes sp.]
MKTLANCTPREFLAQTNKIRKSVVKWLDDTKILEIRSRKPKYAEDATEEEKTAAVTAQIKENFSAMLDAMLDEHPDETAELLGLLCFIEPNELDNHTMPELLNVFTDIVNCPEIIGFFTSLMQLAQKNT